MPIGAACAYLLSSVDSRHLSPLQQAASGAKEMVLIFDLPSALAPSLIAAGYERTEDNLFERNSGDDEVEFNLDADGRFWWISIIVHCHLRSESIVHSITQAVRLLWTFDCIELIEQSSVTVDAEA